MSCGNHHDVPCVEVLSLMWVYIDNEIDDSHRVEVTVHLQECPPLRRSLHGRAESAGQTSSLLY